MSPELGITFGTLFAAMVLFVSDRVRLDVVAVGVLLVLLLTEVLEVHEALAGFANSVVVMVGALFLVGEGLTATGLAARLGSWVAKRGAGGELRLIATGMGIAALLSAFLSSTGAVAILLPVVLRLSRETGTSPSRLLLPVALASLLGGMLTLIGTPPNLVVNQQLIAAGLEPFGFFSFTPVGLLMLAVGMAYALIFGRRLLPARAPVAGGSPTREEGRFQEVAARDLLREYALEERLQRVRIGPSSDLAGMSLREARLREEYGCTVLQLQPPGDEPAQFGQALGPDTRMPVGTVLSLAIEVEELGRLVGDHHLALLEHRDYADEPPESFGAAEIMITPRSQLVGQSLADIVFRDHYQLVVIAMRRGNKAVHGDLTRKPLQAGDTLLVGGTGERMGFLRRRRSDFVVISMPTEFTPGDAESNYRRGPLAAGIVLAMLLLMTFGWVPNVAATLLAALAMVLTGCVRLPQAYGAVNWESLVLIAGMLPAATALEKTGGVQMIVDGILSTAGHLGTTGVLAALFAVTSLLSLVMSNTATSVILAPVALGAAIGLDASPHVFLMTVAIAASTAFSTPMGSPVNTLVLGAGAYRFRDYVVFGLPLQVLVGVLTVIVVPLLF